MKPLPTIAPIFTVFTPTYNRAHTLHRVFESLQQQTLRDFEWLVVDDGSTDGTVQLIQQWRAIADFPILYFQQPNYGKHIAFNRGVEKANGTYFLPIDSDDAFLPDALEKMLHWWNLIPEQQRDTFAGVVALSQYENGEICGESFTESPLDTNSLDLRYIYKKRGECLWLHLTTVLKHFPFPEDLSVRFVPENIVWDAIASQYRIRCINEPLRIFYQDSGNQITKANPQKKARVKEYFLEMLNRDFRYFIHDPISFVKWSVLYVRYSLLAGDKQFLSIKKYRHLGAFLLVLLALIPGALVYLNDHIQHDVKPV
jgi:glycosyltransferase involved in cell wall biosynthesis